MRISFGRHWRQYLLFWLPAQDAPPTKSIVFYVHGGGWRVGAPYLHPGIPRFFLDLGYPVAMPAYRLAPFHNHTQMREDMELALLAVLGLRSKLALPQQKILLGGMSAGATLSALLAYNRPALQKIGLDASLFSGYLAQGGPLDIDQMPDMLPMRQYAGGKPGSISWGEANPQTWIQPDENLPALLTHSRTDAIVPYRAAASFYEKYPAPKHIDLFNIKGTTHLDSLRFAIDDMATAERVRDWLGEIERGEST